MYVGNRQNINKRLEEIVSILENDETSLDESLKLFEEGVNISKELNDKLLEVKGKIEVIKKDAEGKIKLENFDDDI
ncbi:MAG: exodeoxyribonuclease VII small subunit [Elusimicrobia bacterium]|nr:exodeoxyribonuclease VII small subunit [Elusimicrobiota bacterium]